jgi:hypothetical protein
LARQASGSPRKAPPPIDTDAADLHELAQLNARPSIASVMASLWGSVRPEGAIELLLKDMKGETVIEVMEKIVEANKENPIPMSKQFTAEMEARRRRPPRA